MGPEEKGGIVERMTVMKMRTKIRGLFNFLHLCGYILEEWYQVTNKVMNSIEILKFLNLINP
jgi:hypothetical protein